MKHGPFSRRETPDTQTPADAVEQCRTSEIWGRIPRWSQWPAVQAYGGRLKGSRGIEFTTDTHPHPNGTLDRNSPFELRWYLGLTPDVLKRVKKNEEFACILADVDNHQP